MDDAFLDRRTLMRRLSALPLVWGLPAVARRLDGRQDPAGGGLPAALEAALRHARTTDTPVVAVVLPGDPEPVAPTAANEAERRRFEARLRELLRRRPDAAGPVEDPDAPLPRKGPEICWLVRWEDPVGRFLVDLQLLLESPREDVAELLIEATWVCVRAADVGAAPGENVCLLDDRGRREAGAMVALDREQDVVAAVARLLHDPRRLDPRADRQLTPELEQAIADLAAADLDRRQRARQLVAAGFDRHRAALLRARRTWKDERITGALREVAADAWRRARAAGLSGPLPFGLRVEQRGVYDPCPPCGMARVPVSVRALLALPADGG